jgi:hypothetical protein
VQHEPLTSRFPIKAANSFENTAPISPGMFLWGCSGVGKNFCIKPKPKLKTNPRRGAESGFWMARAGSWKLVTVPPCVFEPLTGNPCVFEPVTSYQLPVTGSAPFFFLVPWELGILESGNCDHFPATRKALATLQGPRRAQRLGQSARGAAARAGARGWGEAWVAGAEPSEMVRPIEGSAQKIDFLKRHD